MNRRIFMLTIVGVLATASAAFAAWLIYTGASGTATGNFATAGSAGTAITMAPQGTGYDVAVVPGGTGQGVNWTLTNNDPSQAHTVSGVTATFTTTPQDCGAHMSIPAADLALFNVTVPAGGTTTVSGIHVVADSSLPNDCSGGTWSVQLTGSA